MAKVTDALVKESLDIKDAVKNGAYNVDYALIYDQIKLAALLALNPTTPEEAQDKFNIVSINLSTSLGERKDLDIFFHNDDDVNGELGLPEALEALTQSKKPLMIVINDHSHFVNVALTSNDEGTISVKYMNGMVPGDGIKKELPMVGKEFANKLYDYLKKKGVKLAKDGVEDISRDQQVGEACGLTVASNIASIVKNQELFSPKNAQEKQEHYQDLGMKLVNFVAAENARMSAPAAPAQQPTAPSRVDTPASPAIAPQATQSSAAPVPQDPQVATVPTPAVAEAPTLLQVDTPAALTSVSQDTPTSSAEHEEEEKKRRAAAAEAAAQQQPVAAERSNLYSNKDLRNVIDEYEEKRRKALEARNINVPPEQNVREYLYAHRAAVGVEVLNEITQINKSQHEEMQKKGDFKPITFNKIAPSPWQIKDPSGGVLHELTYRPDGNLIMAAVPTKATKGPLHISLALQDANGDNIDADKALFFDISYDDDGKVASISHPEPLKFVGTHPDEKCMFEVEGKPYFLKINKKTLDDLHKQLEQNRKEDKELDKPAGIVITIPDSTPVPALDTVSLPQPSSPPIAPPMPKPADRAPSSEDDQPPAPILKPITVSEPKTKSLSGDMTSELKRKQEDMQARIKANIVDSTYHMQGKPVAAQPEADEESVSRSVDETRVLTKEKEGSGVVAEAKPAKVEAKKTETGTLYPIRPQPLFVQPSLNRDPAEHRRFSGPSERNDPATAQKKLKDQIAQNIAAREMANKEAAAIKEKVASSGAVVAAKPPQKKPEGSKAAAPAATPAEPFNPHTMKATARVETPPPPISPMPGGKQAKANDGVSRKS